MISYWYRCNSKLYTNIIKLQSLLAQDVPNPVDIVGEEELADLESEEFAGPEAPWWNTTL